MSMFNYNCKEDFLVELEAFLEKETTLSKRSISTYLRKISNKINVEWSVGDLCGAIDMIIEDYSTGGKKYNPKDRGNTRAALQKVRLFVRKKLLDDFGALKIIYKKGWQSFVPVNKHFVEYKIDGDFITVKYNKHFTPVAKPEIKEIPTRELEHLIYLLKRAKKCDLLADTNTVRMHEIHGPIESYYYELDGECGKDCSSLFKDGKSKVGDDLCKDYDVLIKKIIG